MNRQRTVIRSIPVALIVAVMGCAAQESGGDSDRFPLAGAWEALEYELDSGPTYEVRGRIFFSETDWTVLFFVVDGEGEVRRGSAEGGTYTLVGSDLVFTHLYNLSQGTELQGLPAAPLQMTARDGLGPTEPSTISIEGDRLEIHFPSGNAMRFARRR